MLDSLSPEIIVALVVALLTFVLFLVVGGSKSHKAQLKGARESVRRLINEINCNPILVRLAWHDSGTYDKSKEGKGFAIAGGANGSIIYEPEIKHGANAGLVKAVNYLKPIKQLYPLVSWADLIQMASAEAIAHAGGPKIQMKYGRKDVAGPKDCPKEGNLPGAAAPFGDGASSPAQHLRNVFYRMGFNDQEIVALSGAHTIGRAFKDRSGTTDKKETKFTCPAAIARADGKKGIGMKGGESWTEKWLKFDNSYFTTPRDPELLRLETDICLETDPKFKPHFDKYKNSQEAFFEDYAKVHKKLSELGSVFEPEEGIYID